MGLAEAVHEVHGRDETSLCGGAADVREIGIGGFGGDGADDAAVQGDFGCKVREVQGAITGGLLGGRVKQLVGRIHLQLGREGRKPLLQADLYRLGLVQDHPRAEVPCRLEILDGLQRVEPVKNIGEDGGESDHMAKEQRAVTHGVVLMGVWAKGVGEILFHQVLDGPVGREDVRRTAMDER